MLQDTAAVLMIVWTLVAVVVTTRQAFRHLKKK
jgi:hypothetical protein